MQGCACRHIQQVRADGAEHDGGDRAAVFICAAVVCGGGGGPAVGCPSGSRRRRRAHPQDGRPRPQVENAGRAVLAA